MTLIKDCNDLTDCMCDYEENALSPEERAQFDGHLLACNTCRDAVEHFKDVQNLLRVTPGPAQLSLRFRETTGQRLAAIAAAPAAESTERVSPHESGTVSVGWQHSAGAAPWWLVSTALHILIIALASLVTMAIELPRNNDAVIMITELQQARAVLADESQKKPSSDLTDVMEKKDTPATDLTSKEMSDIVVPPDILAKAEQGDHYETIDPDRPDTHSAYGNTDSKSFHSVEGDVSAAGGGGMGGLGMDDLIGVGGAAGKGTGGGWDGGDGTGVGVGSGAGKGSFGQRTGGGRKLLVKRNGGNKATEGAVELALKWLAYHQEADGHWNVVKHGGGISPGYGCAADAAGDVGMTGLATLAFLGAGNTPKVGSYRDNVKRALEFLMNRQRQDGTFSDVRAQDYDRYDAALGTLALTEAFAMLHDQKLGECARRGVEYLVKLQKPHGGWVHYTWNSTSFFGWVVMALKSAKIAGINVPHQTFEGALAFMEKASERDAGGYWGKVRYDPFNAFEVNKGLTMTAVGMTALEFIGHGSETGRQAEMIAEFPPEWDPGRSFEREPQNFYHWYYGTLGLFQHGGDLWKKWNEGLIKTLPPNQRKDGDEAGSWDPVAAFDSSGGRVYTTAMGALTLEVYYRYLRLNSEK